MDGPAPHAGDSFTIECVFEIRCSSASSADHVNDVDIQSHTPQSAKVLVPKDDLPREAGENQTELLLSDAIMPPVRC